MRCHNQSNIITKVRNQEQENLCDCETQQYQVGVAPYIPHPQQKVQKHFILFEVDLMSMQWVGGLNHSILHHDPSEKPKESLQYQVLVAPL
jgi:hypothetical protein